MTTPITQHAVSAHVAVGHAAPVELATPTSGPAGGGHLLVRVVGANPVFLGGATVVASPSGEEEGGFELKPTDAPVLIPLNARGRLYGICGGSLSSEVHILRV